MHLSKKELENNHMPIIPLSLSVGLISLFIADILDLGISASQGFIFGSSIAFILFLKLIQTKKSLQRINATGPTTKLLLAQLKEAKSEMLSLREVNEKLLVEGREERKAVLMEAKRTKDYIIAQAKAQAKKEVQQIIIEAREKISKEQSIAIAEIIAYLKNEFKDNTEATEMIEELAQILI